MLRCTVSKTSKEILVFPTDNHHAQFREKKNVWYAIKAHQKLVQWIINY